MKSLACFFLGLLLLGCQSAPPPPPLPTYPLMDAGATRAAMSERARAITDVSAQALITLTRPDGDSMRLDAVVAMAPPDRARIMAWKFNQIVFDMTVTPDGVWLLTGDDPARKDAMRTAGSGAARLAKTWALLSGGFFSGDDYSVHEDGGLLDFSRTDADGSTQCQVDRTTLTVRGYCLFDAAGRPQFLLEMNDYALYGQNAWPNKITAKSKWGTVVLSLHNVQVNGGLADTAFVPPARAEKLP